MDVICPHCGRNCKAHGNKRGYRLVTSWSRLQSKKQSHRYVYKLCDHCEDRNIGRS